MPLRNFRLPRINKRMTKFESIITDICEANNYPAPGTQQPANNQQQAQQAAKPTASTPVNTQNQQATTTANNTAQQPANNTAKPNYDLLVKDFNNPNVKINSITDLKKYGIATT